MGSRVATSLTPPPPPPPPPPPTPGPQAAKKAAGGGGFKLGGAPKAAAPGAASSTEGVDPRTIAFPLSLLATAGICAVFAEEIEEGAFKDSAVLGAGFEVEMKGEEGAVGFANAWKSDGVVPAVPNRRPAAGTKKVQKKK